MSAATTQRDPLDREAIVARAVAFADERGTDALSMRKLAAELGYEVMSLYNHVANKDDILDGIVERVLAEIPLPADDGDWKEEMRERAVAARRIFLRHPWAIGLLEARHAGSSPARLSYYDAVLGCLRSADFTAALSMRAFSIIDSFVYGFIFQELSLPFDDSDSLEEVGEDLLRQMADAYPHLTEATVQAMADGWDYAEQFQFGLDLILDALAGQRDSS